MRFFLFIITAGLTTVVTPAVLAQAEKEVRVQEGALEAHYHPASGELHLLHNGSLFLDARLPGSGAAAVQITTNSIFGSGKSILIPARSEEHLVISLYPSAPFVFVQGVVRNSSNGPVVLREFEALRGKVNLDRPISQLRTFGTGGLLSPTKNPGSYAWLAVVQPESRKGVVFGWVTGERGSGVIFTSERDGTVETSCRLQYGKVRLAPNRVEQLDTLAIGYFEDARLGLEQWADAVARANHVHLPPQPAGYCTWYSRPYGGASDEKHLAEQAELTSRELAPFGFTVIQIDDHWQAGISTNGPKRQFTAHAPKGPYPAGMKAMAEKVKGLGLVPGIWFMPFAGTYYDPYFHDHQDWFVTHEDGTAYETAWGGTCLDMTHPGAREHLRRLIGLLSADWGFQYFKMDGLWTGTGTRQQYVNSGYKDDNMGDAVFHDPSKSNIEAYRSGLRLVRETAGSNVFLLGCCSPQNMRSYAGAFGLVDAMRIGPDNGAEWKSLLRGPTFGSRHYFLNGRVWYNDPDPVYVRPTVPLNQARLICSWVALSGQLNLHSEWLPGLPPERLEILKRSVPAHGLMARPADLFEREIPSLWLLSDARTKPERHVIGVFNWQDTDQEFEYSLPKLGLAAGTTYDAFDFWDDEQLPQLRDRLKLSVPAQSCRIIAVRAAIERPHVVSTSRHITQGIVDILEEKWEPASATLHGRSKVVANDRYELRVLAAGPAAQFSVTDARDGTPLKAATVRQTNGLVRASFVPSSSGEISWVFKFAAS